MTTLSNFFAWIFLLFPSGPSMDSGTPQLQPCSSPIETVCQTPPAETQQTERREQREGRFRAFWKNANRNGISNGI